MDRVNDHFSSLLFKSQHEDYTHAQQSCGPCGGRLLFVGEVEAHYLESLNHPVCSDCLVGFEDNFSYKDVSA